MPKLAIIDWGIGGMGFYRLLKERHPDVPAIYFSDNGERPYGTHTAQSLSARLGDVFRYLASRGAGQVVVACNAASSVLPLVRPRSGETLPVFTGVITHAINLVRRTHAKTVGVIGGERTIRSNVYGRALRTHTRSVRQRVAQPLSAYIERGEMDSVDFHNDLEHILAPLRGIDLLLLACTHYPAISDAIASRLPGTTLLDPIQEVMHHVERTWQLPRSSAPDIFVTTGDPNAMQVSARNAFGVDTGEVEYTSIIPTHLS